MRSLLIIILSCLFGSSAFAQAVPASSSPDFYRFNPEGNAMFVSPDVAAFQKYNFYDIRLYTGKIDLSVPIYTIEEGNIKIPISLSYNSGGIKVDEIASNVGIGWNLNAGGNVVRNIKDMEDNYQKQSSWTYQDGGFEGHYTKHEFIYMQSKGYFRNESEMSLGSRPNGKSLVYGLAKEDASPDIFTAIGPFLNSRFILQPKRVFETTAERDMEYNISFLDGNGYKGFEVLRRNLGIQPFGFDNREIQGLQALHHFVNSDVPMNIGSENPVFDYTKFQLLSTEGHVYTFDQTDVTEAMPSYVPSGWSTGGGHLLFTFLMMKQAAIASHKRSIDAWHLGSIYDYSSNKKVSFSYEKYSKPTTYKFKNVSNDALRNDANPNNNSLNNQIFAYGHLPNFQDEVYINVSEEYAKNSYFYTKGTQLNRLTTISWSNGSVQFIYGHTREDNYDNEKALTEIVVKDLNGETIKHYRLRYSYAVSKEGCSSWVCKRLRLDAVEEISGSDVHPYYRFEYDNTNPLPKINSLQQDFFGYYNNNGQEKSEDFSVFQSPTLYYHKDQYNLSILPFQRTDGTFTKQIPGNFSLLPNAYSLSGLLRKVVFPSGGYSEFEYENHRFLINGIEYSAGGARVKEQHLFDGKNERHLIYEYLDVGKSSGSVNNFPTFGYPWGYDPNKPTNNVSFVSFDKNRGNIELTDGSYVGYSKVTVRESGNGRKEYFYTSPSEHQNEKDIRIGETFPGQDGELSAFQKLPSINFLEKNSNYPGVNYIDNDIKRGKMTKQLSYDQAGQLVKEQRFDYSHKIFSELPLSYQVVLDSYFPSTVWTPEPANCIIKYTSKLRLERNLLSTNEEIDYTSGIPTVTKIETYTYHDSYPFVKKIIMVNSALDQSTMDFKFVADSENSTVIEHLKRQNRLGELLEMRQSLNGNLLSKSTLSYNVMANVSSNDGIPDKAIIKPAVFLEERRNGGIPNEVSYGGYDRWGNVGQYRVDTGPVTSYIWGYNGQYPIGKAVNALSGEFTIMDVDQDGKFLCNHYDNMPLDFEIETDPVFGYAIAIYSGIGFMHFSNQLDANKVYEMTFWELESDFGEDMNYATVLSSEIVAERGNWNQRRIRFTAVNGGLFVNANYGHIKNLVIKPADAQVSTYTYRPLVGMTSMTDPRGITEYYKYDGFQRLKDVLDFESNVLKNYQYHYKPGTN